MKDIENKIIQTKTILETKKQTLQDIKNKNNLLLEEKLKSETIIKIVEQIAEIKTINKKQEISNAITKALNIIYPDNYEFKIDSNKEELELKKNGITIFKGDKYIEKSSGGGILSVISFILKTIISIINYNIKFFIYDENFSAIHTEYLPKLSEYLYSLCKEYNIHIILITHAKEMTTFSNIKYELESIDQQLQIKNNSNSLQNKPYYKLEIKNFQSIKHIELYFQGYTTIQGVNDIGKSAIVKALLSLLNSE